MSVRCLVGCFFLVGCSGTVARPVGFTYDLNMQQVAVAGTGVDDLWRLTGDGKTAQEDTFDLHVQHWDGTRVSTVPFGETFREGSCGRPSAWAAVARGELWLGSFHVPGCGFGPGLANDKLIFGKLKVDGSWEDRSSDFPPGPPGTYKAIELFGREGVLYVVVTYDPGPSTYKLFRYAADGTRTELPLPPESPPQVRAIGADELLTTGGRSTSMFKNGAWSTLPPTSFDVSLFHVNAQGERWSFGGITAGQTPVVYRYDGTTFTAVELKPKNPDDGVGGVIPIGLVPRGGGKFTWVLTPSTTRTKTAEFSVTARDWDGTALGPVRVLSTPSSCPSTESACAGELVRLYAVLQDGNFLVGSANGTWYSVLISSAVP